MLPTDSSKYDQNGSNTLRVGSLMIRRGLRRKQFLSATEAAEALGISKQTLLRYEARGLFPKAARNPLNRWREYTSEDIKNLRQLMGR